MGKVNLLGSGVFWRWSLLAVYSGGKSEQSTEPVYNLSADPIFPRRACLPRAHMTTFKRISITALAILVLEAGAMTETTKPEGFSFKGNPLGMTLLEFKVANPRQPCFTQRDVSARKQYETAVAEARSKAEAAEANVTVLQTNFSYVRGKDAKAAALDAIRTAITDAQAAGLASGTLQGQAPPRVPEAIDFGYPASNETKCSSGDNSLGALEIGSSKVSSVVYQFLNDKLYKVAILFPSVLAGSIKEAFTTKYGEPAALPPDAYQNGFGASWKGTNFAWTNGPQSILLHEGANNGPGQDYSATSGQVTYEDRSLEPAPAKAATNF
jgi:hypothetical protein